MNFENCVYVVDDDASARNGLARLLRTAGYSVYAYNSGEKFLDNLNANICGCLLLDIRMPGLSGEELVTELKARDVNLSIIVVTADDEPETRQKAKKMNAKGFFRKPVDGTALIDAINWALRSTSKEGNNQITKRD